MGMLDFKRYDGFANSIPQQFIDKNFPKCPMCGTMAPHWMLKDKMTFTESRMMFKCNHCGCILSCSVADYSGLSKSKAATVLTTAGGLNAIMKKASGKKVGVVYLKVEEVGSAQTTQINAGKEFTMEELQEMANSI